MIVFDTPWLHFVVYRAYSYVPILAAQNRLSSTPHIKYHKPKPPQTKNGQTNHYSPAVLPLYIEGGGTRQSNRSGMWRLMWSLCSATSTCTRICNAPCWGCGEKWTLHKQTDI